MKIQTLARLLCCFALWSGLDWDVGAVTPPVVRSIEYNGAHSNIFHYPVQPWMNTNTALMTAEAWVYCNDLNGFQAFVARHFTTNLWFGLTGNRLRFYRSGGTFADSDGTLVVGRWTHVAVSYDGSTARFFINGSSAGVKALANAGNNCTNSLSIGGQHDVLNAGDTLFGGYAFNGYLDEVRLWSVVRSQSAIASGMNSEVRSGTGLEATFGTGGRVNNIRGDLGGTEGIPAVDRYSGFGILPAGLCIPRTANNLRLDANIDILNEYRGAETLVLRSTTSATAPDQVAYLIVGAGTNNHLYVGVPNLPQAGLPQIPVVQVMADVNVTNGTGLGLGDWECHFTQDSFQGSGIYGVNPPFFPDPAWMSWGQSFSNWNGITGGSFEFHQSYEFRIHARHLNHFSNTVGLLVRYYNYDAGGDQTVGPRSAVTNLPATYAQATWCGNVDLELSFVTIAGSVTNLSGNVGVSGRTVSLYSGDSELSGLLMANTTTDAQGKFLFSNVQVPNERKLAVTYAVPGNVVLVEPAYDTTYSPTLPVATNSPYSVTFPLCPSSCTYGRLNFRYRQLGPVQVTGVSPMSIPAVVIVRTDPLKTTGGDTITVFGTNFPSSVNVFFKGSGCGLIPPNLCSSDWHEANIVSRAADGLSLVAEVPSALNGVATTSRGFQIVVENPSFGSTGGNQWNYGPIVTVTPPSWPQLYGFEFINEDDGPSWEEFEASYGDSIFSTVPFTDIPLPGVRDPYYGVYFLVYMAWMDLARGSCSGLAATARLMADGDIPAASYDRPDNGDVVHGVRFPNGYIGQPNPGFLELSPTKPGRYTGFDLFRPFSPINVWARITSFQGAQTSAEFLNTWLGQLHRPIVGGPRRGICVGDPMLVLSRIRTDARANLIVLGGREFQLLHTVTPYGVLDENGLSTDLLTPEPRTGFSLIKIYDSNRPGEERFIEVDRAQNTFRYRFGSRTGAVQLIEGAGLFYMPMSVFRGRRHVLGPTDISANIDHFIRILHTGTATSTIEDGTGGIAGWSGTNLVNTYNGASPFVPPGAFPEEPEQFDRTMFFLPDTNAPTRAWFRSSGSNVFLHYALGQGDFGYGFKQGDMGASNSVDGILIGLNQGLLAVGFKAGAPVEGFGAMVSSRDGKGQSRVFILDGGAGAMTPDLQLERDGFHSLTIRNRSAAPFSFRLNLAGHDAGAGTFEYAYDVYTQPGKSTLTLRLPENAAIRSLTRELDTDNDGSPEIIQEAPANGQLRIADEAGQIALRWRQAGFGETLERSPKLTPDNWSPLTATITNEGPDRIARINRSADAEFYRLNLSGGHCLDLSKFSVGARPNPWETNGFKFEALSAAGAMLPQTAIASRSGFTGLDVVHTVRVHPMHDCEIVHLDVFQTSGHVTFEAVGPLGTVVARQTLTGVGTVPQRVSLRGFRSRIHYVRVVSPNALCLIVNVCCERAQTISTPPFTQCLSFTNLKAGQYQSPYTIDDVTLSIANGKIQIEDVSGLSGEWLKLGGQVELVFASPSGPCDRVTLRLRDLEGAVTAKAFNSSGAEVATAGPLPPSATPQTLIVNGAGIVRVVLSSNSDKAFLQDICCSRNVQ